MKMLYFSIVLQPLAYLYCCRLTDLAGLYSTAGCVYMDDAVDLLPKQLGIDSLIAWMMLHHNKCHYLLVTLISC